MPKTFKKVLIANRGEIALRIARTLREMGIDPIAIYSDADRRAPHVRASQMAFHVGPSPSSESYLVSEKILEVAKKAGADAIHPGYGFLSENAEFADAVEKAGITFIGPPSDAMRKMGSKTAAREAMQKAGVPVVPGTEALKDEKEALAEAEKMGFPVMLKASAGGGGKGMRLVFEAKELGSALRAAQSEAQNAFGDSTVYMEKAIIKPRHVEIQIFSGADGKTVWLGERECSMQRRHQKVIEETPSPAIDESVRRAMGEVACKAAEAVDYVGAGTVEFLLDQDKNFYFLEMNTRLQVEHPVTEYCCGLDLVEWQVRVAQGENLPWDQDEIVRHGHSMEARIYAEDPDRGFMPSPGFIQEFLLPSGAGVRVDAGVAGGLDVSMFYDPMVAKVIVWAKDRESCRRRLDRALQETVVKGIKTNTRFLRHLIATEGYVSGDYHTGSIDEMMSDHSQKIPAELNEVAMAAAVVDRFRRDKSRVGSMGNSDGIRPSAWRAANWRMRGV